MPGAAPEPLQVSQVSCRGIWIVGLGACCRLLERDLEVVAEIGAALRPAAAAAAEHAAEAEDVAEAAEDVVELGEDRRVEAGGAAAAPDTAAWPKRS